VKRSILGVLLIFTFVAVGIAAAPSLTFTFSDVKANKTAIETDTYGVNASGAIAGDYVDSKTVQHAMILKGAKLTTIDDKNCSSSPGSTGIALYGINSAGSAVGWCTSTKTGLPIGLLYTKGKLSEFSVPKATETEATGINDKGDIVGTFFDANGAQHGFLLHAKKYTQLDAPKDTATIAWGITNKGQITLYATSSAGTFDSFLLTGKKYKNINNPNAKGGLGTIVHAPNNKGDIDGTYYDSTGAEKGWLLHGGKYYDVVDPGGITRADGLNDKLEIVGRYGSGTYGGTGFKATTK
jgi:probable HAF family extracellular repeat protein